jgi:propanol-preferring alcohol dehydrogenase
MQLTAPRSPLRRIDFAVREPSRGEIHIAVEACGVCRTDLHLVDSELPDIRYPITPGHEIVGRVAALGANVDGFRIGQRAGVPWREGRLQGAAVLLPQAYPATS